MASGGLEPRAGDRALRQERRRPATQHARCRRLALDGAAGGPVPGRSLDQASGRGRRQRGRHGPAARRFDRADRAQRRRHRLCRAVRSPGGGRCVELGSLRPDGGARRGAPRLAGHDRQVPDGATRPRRHPRHRRAGRRRRRRHRPPRSDGRRLRPRRARPSDRRAGAHRPLGLALLPDRGPPGPLMLFWTAASGSLKRAGLEARGPARFHRTGTCTTLPAMENPYAPTHPEIRDAVRHLCLKFDGAYWRKLDRERAYPTEFVKALTDAGWLATLIPEEYGSAGLGISAAAAVLEEVQRAGCNGAACHAQMYIMGTVLRHGSAEQKERYLPRIASGELRLQAFGVTEPTSGTDTLALRTTAVKKDNSTYIVNGQKV